MVCMQMSDVQVEIYSLYCDGQFLLDTELPPEHFVSIKLYCTLFTSCVIIVWRKNSWESK